MKDHFVAFCKKHDIDPERKNLDSLQHISRICQEVISRDCVYPTHVFSQTIFEQYLALIQDYSEHFLPHAHHHRQNIVALNHLSTLQYAALRGYDRYIEQLPEMEKEWINAGNHYGMTALHLAACQGHLSCCKFLCERGAAVTLPNHQNQLPLFCVLTDPERPGAGSLSQQAKVFRYLWQRNPETLRHLDDFAQNALHLMAMYGHVELLEEALLQAPELALLTNSHGAAPVHVAINHQQLPALETIIAHVPQAMTVPGHKSRLPLHYAVLVEDPAIVAYCCKQNHTTEVVNARDTDSKTPWIMAYEESNQDILDVLEQYSPEKSLGLRKI